MSDEVAPCHRCRQMVEERSQWMLGSSPLPARRRFYCHRCRGVMRIYGLIALLLVLAVIGCIAAVPLLI